MRNTTQIFLVTTLLIAGCGMVTQDDKAETVDKVTADSTVANNAEALLSDAYINGIAKSVDQDLHGTKIVLSELGDPYDLHLYRKIEFFVNDRKVLVYEEKYLEIEGYQDNISTFFQLLENGDYVSFYVLRNNNRPSPDKFLVFKQTGIEIEFVGTTEQSTADIFGDVDLDGKFEIGGFNVHCEPGPQEHDMPGHPLFCIDHLRIYEIANGFERDTVLENSIISRKNAR